MTQSIELELPLVALQACAVIARPTKHNNLGVEIVNSYFSALGVGMLFLYYAENFPKDLHIRIPSINVHSFLKKLPNKATGNFTLRSVNDERYELIYASDVVEVFTPFFPSEKPNGIIRCCQLERYNEYHGILPKLDGAILNKFRKITSIVNGIQLAKIEGIRLFPTNEHNIFKVLFASGHAQGFLFTDDED